MIEKYPSYTDLQALHDATTMLVSDAPRSDWLNTFMNENRFVYRVPNDRVSQALAEDIGMADKITQAATTDWEIDIVQTTDNRSHYFKTGMRFTAMYALSCITDRPSGIRLQRQSWNSLDLSDTDNPTFKRELEPMTVDFTTEGLIEFGNAYRTGFDSDTTRAYIDKLKDEDPEYATTIAGFIAQACGITDQQPDVAPEPETQPIVEPVGVAACRALTTLIGSLSIADQMGRASR